MSKVIYTAKHRLALPGKSGVIYRLRKGGTVETDDGELDAFPDSFDKQQKKRRRTKKADGV